MRLEGTADDDDALKDAGSLQTGADSAALCNACFFSVAVVEDEPAAAEWALRRKGNQAKKKVVSSHFMVRMTNED